uniref:Uncharacterized protein n=1 Tax=Arundo donax TaxID=35708 RepID=A0A0A9HP62_ARUDO
MPLRMNTGHASRKLSRRCLGCQRLLLRDPLRRRKLELKVFCHSRPAYGGRGLATSQCLGIEIECDVNTMHSGKRFQYDPRVDSIHAFLTGKIMYSWVRHFCNNCTGTVQKQPIRRHVSFS